MYKVSLIAFVVSFCSFLSSANSFDKEEHFELGSESFLRACGSVKADMALYDIDKSAKDRFDIICNKSNSVIYGQATQLSGDHTSKPIQTEMTSEELEKLTDFFEYVELAKNNSDHFHPGNIITWKEFHQKAIKKAHHFSSLRDPIEINDLVLEVLYFSAFADHFLHDAFASGHIIPRKISGTGSSGAMHDKLNEVGIRMRNVNGDIWTAYGDGYLKNYENDYVMNISSASVEDVIRTAVLGEDNLRVKNYIIRSIPKEFENFNVIEKPGGANNNYDIKPNGNWEPLGAKYHGLEVTKYYSLGPNFYFGIDTKNKKDVYGFEMEVFNYNVDFFGLIGNWSFIGCFANDKLCAGGVGITPYIDVYTNADWNSIWTHKLRLEVVPSYIGFFSLGFGASYLGIADLNIDQTRVIFDIKTRYIKSWGPDELNLLLVGLGMKIGFISTISEMKF